MSKKKTKIIDLFAWLRKKLRKEEPPKVPFTYRPEDHIKRLAEEVLKENKQSGRED